MVRSDLQVENVPKYLEIMKNHLSENPLDIWKNLKNNLENNRIPNGFDYFKGEVIIIQRPTNWFSRQIDWLVSCGWGTLSWSSLGPFKISASFCFISYLLFCNCYKLFRVDPCRADVSFWYLLTTSESFPTSSGCNRGEIG